MILFPFRNIKQCRITCIYGTPGKLWASGKHDGIDIVSDGDKTILSVTDGKVIRVRNTGDAGFGQHVVIQMQDGRSLIYGHMVVGSAKVTVGQRVKAGQELGVMGNSGNSGGAHLHIELQKKYYKSGATDDIAEFLGIQNIKSAYKKSGDIKMVGEVFAVTEIDKVSDWAKESQEWVKENNISDGKRPKAVLTREECWVFLQRLSQQLKK